MKAPMRLAYPIRNPIAQRDLGCTHWVFVGLPFKRRAWHCPRCGQDIDVRTAPIDIVVSEDNRVGGARWIGQLRPWLAPAGGLSLCETTDDGALSIADRAGPGALSR